MKFKETFQDKPINSSVENISNSSIENDNITFSMKNLNTILLSIKVNNKTDSIKLQFKI